MPLLSGSSAPHLQACQSKQPESGGFLAALPQTLAGSYRPASWPVQLHPAVVLVWAVPSEEAAPFVEAVAAQAPT